MLEKIKKPLIAILLSSVAIVLVVVMYGLFIIYKEVQTTCTTATQKYKKTTCVESLIGVLESDTATPKEKNDAIWALGQMADKRALPTLKAMYKGVPDGREPLNEVVSQYEIAKAIKWCEEGNLTHYMYRNIK